jgi:hypothetical protein
MGNVGAMARLDLALDLTLLQPRTTHHHHHLPVLCALIRDDISIIATILILSDDIISYDLPLSAAAADTSSPLSACSLRTDLR